MKLGQSINELRGAVEAIHGGVARFRKYVTASGTHKGKTVSTRQVAVFDLEGNAAAVCYAWTEAAPAGKSRTCTVLQLGPVQSAGDAITASMLRDSEAEALSTRKRGQGRGKPKKPQRESGSGSRRPASLA